jgi:hypothetical protein
MEAVDNISEAAKRKLQLYVAATYLFDSGKSHPQIVDLLENYEPDKLTLTQIVDKAMRNDWDKLHEQARVLLGQGKIYSEVLSELYKKEPDKEIVQWICNEWYEWRTMYMECMIESPGNVSGGLKWIIICILAIPLLFWMKVSWFSKAIWIAALVASVLQWIIGMKQRALIKKIEHLFKSNE